MLWARLSQKLSRCIWGEREVPVKQVFWCSNRETWTFSCYQDSGVLTGRLELSLAIKIWRFRIFPNHAEEITAFCRQTYHSCSHTHGMFTHCDLDISLILENPHMFRNPNGSVCLLQDHHSSHWSSWCSCLVQSDFLSTQLTHVGLLWVAQPFPMNCLREFWNWGLGLSTRLTGDMEKPKRSNTFKGLGWSQLDFFSSQQEVF